MAASRHHICISGSTYVRRNGRPSAPNPKRWFIKFPTNAYVLGPTTKRFDTEEEARAHVREIYGAELQDEDFHVWRASDNYPKEGVDY